MQHPCATSQTGSTFNQDGSFFFAGRYEVLQRFDFTGCGGPQAPFAGIGVQHRTSSTDGWDLVPERVFPGDELRVRSTSSGEITNTAIWITDLGGTTVAPTGGGTSETAIDYSIPDGGTDEQPSSRYTGHVEVSNSVGFDQCDRAGFDRIGSAGDHRLHASRALDLGYAQSLRDRRGPPRRSIRQRPGRPIPMGDLAPSQRNGLLGQKVLRIRWWQWLARGCWFFLRVGRYQPGTSSV